MVPADKEPVLCHSTVVYKHASKILEYNSAFDPAKLKATMKEDQNGITWHLNVRGRGADPLEYEMDDKNGFYNTPELECMDNFVNGEENEVRDSVGPRNVPSELFEMDRDLYTDKNVTEFELPELIVCYKDSTYHFVKDICTDEGVPSEDKILIERGNKHSDMTKGSVDTEFLVQDGLKSLSDSDIDKDAACKCGTESNDGLKSLLESDIDQYAANAGDSEDPKQMGEENCNATEIMDDALTEEFVSNDMLLAQEFCTQASPKSLLESNYSANNVEQQSGQISSVEEIPKNPAAIIVHAAEGPNKSGPTNNLSYDSKVESGTITFNFNSCKTAFSTRDESPENVCEQSLESQNVPIHNVISDNLSDVSQVQHGEGESSFSMAGLVSGQITYSGPISLSYSGSISLRSDSSTTSARSFAFPVLQSEWNSSPVRMAKADRRLFRKHRGWRHGLFCCRF